MQKPAMIFGQSKRITFSRHHVEPRVQLYVPKEDIFPIPLKYTDVTRTTHDPGRMIIGTWMRIEILSESWTGFTQLTILHEKLPDGYMWFGERLTQMQPTTKPDHLWPSMSKAARRKEKQHWAIEKSKLDNARKLTASILSIWMIKSSKKPKTQGKSWKSQRKPLCLSAEDDEEFAPSSGNRQQNQQNPKIKTCMHRRSSQVYEKSVWKVLYQKITKITLRKGVQVVESLKSCAQVRSYAPSDENSSCKKSSSSGQRLEVTRKVASMAHDQGKEQKRDHPRKWEKLEKLPAWHMTKVKSKRGIIQENGRSSKSCRLGK